MPSSRPPGAGRPPPSQDRGLPRRRHVFRDPSIDGVRSSGEIVEGTVSWFDPGKGFGFVELAEGAGKAFLHASALEARRLRFPAEGARLRGRVGEGPKGLQITEVLELHEGAAPAEPARRPPPAGRPPSRPARGAAARPPGVPMLGTVKFFDAAKGFGFVDVEDDGADVFLHASVLRRTGMADPVEGQWVLILATDGPKGREATAVAPVG